MLNLNEFANYCEEKLKKRFSEKDENVQVTITEVTKNNGVLLHGINVKKEEHSVAPIIYLESFYEKYKNGTSLNDTIDLIYEVATKEENFSNDFNGIEKKFMDFDFVKNKIIAVLVNKDDNEELLKQIPYTIYDETNLAVIYKVLLNENMGIRTATITIHSNHLSFWNITKEELHKVAMCNTDTKNNISITGMSETLTNLMSDELSVDECSYLFNNGKEDARPLEERMYIITNQSRVNGAIAAFCDSTFEILAEKLEGDFYILPSSIHECIAVSTYQKDPIALKAMVMEINADTVDKQEKLSDNIYFVHAKDKTLKML